MSQEEFLKALEDDAKRERDSILEKARMEAENILKSAEEEKNRLKEDFLKNLRFSLKRESFKAVNEAKKESKKEILNLKQDIIEEVFKEAESEAGKLVDTPEYQAILEKLLLEVLQEIEGESTKGKIIIYASKKDHNILKGVKTPPSFSHDIEIKTGDLDSAKGGLILTTEDGRISIENTFSSRRRKARKFLLPSLREILFPEKERD